MNRRLLVLSSVVLVSSGALIFACSSGDDTSDSGTDSGPGKDATTDTGKKDSTTNDVSTNDVTTNDASDGATDSATDSGPSDAGGGLTFMVVRVGGFADAGVDASLASGVGQAIYLEERNVSDGSLVRTLSMPTASSGSNNAFTMTGTTVSEGELTQSTDGKFVVVAGYNAVPGATGVGTSSVDSGVVRVVARVNAAGTIDTTTGVNAYDLTTIRGAVSDDGGSFWTTGSGVADAAANTGVQYALLGATGASTSIAANPANTRTVGIFGGQVYMVSGSPPFVGVSTIGTGLPTTTGQTATLLTGFQGYDAGSPYGFSMLDMDASVSGLDTLYVADDSSLAGYQGIQKWVNTGSTWVKIATFTNGTAKGFRGVTAVISGGNVIVIGTTSDSSPNTVIKYIDDGVNLTPTGTVLATSLTGTIYRGIAMSPQ